jgi:dolichol-phosphate mannosyltransferase
MFDFRPRHAGESKLDPFVIWQFMTFLLSKATYGWLPARFISFLFVGGSGVAVHFATLYAALAVSGNFAFAQASATILAATSNFLLNNILTFRDRVLRGRRMLTGYVTFMLTASVGILANVSAAVVTLDRLTDVVFVAALAGILIDTLWKFVISNRFIWR